VAFGLRVMVVLPTASGPTLAKSIWPNRFG
jgi:hypothetical protein